MNCEDIKINNNNNFQLDCCNNQDCNIITLRENNYLEDTVMNTFCIKNDKYFYKNQIILKFTKRHM